MEGISKDELIRLQSSIFARDDEECANVKLRMLTIIIDQCHEPQEPWMTLDEFLNSGFEGLCWVYSVYKDIFVVQFIDDNFISINTGAKAQLKYIERVMPIHKPEPPR